MDRDYKEGHRKDNCPDCKRGLVYVGHGEHLTSEQMDVERGVVQLNHISKCLEQLPQG